MRGLITVGEIKGPVIGYDIVEKTVGADFRNFDVGGDAAPVADFAPRCRPERMSQAVGCARNAPVGIAMRVVDGLYQTPEGI
jgi:hypothetical protein